ncbi:SDR family oxidoreductase [Aquihabitans daechungensis]|uniref:SDR family oxidoreductase n=1 Tax=Aquihabitans daechungensis TaxID=1052257 RepID=UPI003BA37CA4
MSAGAGLEGTGALVTGGGSGIGLAIAARLAADGATVTICGRSVERLEAAIEQTDLAGGPGSLHAIAADVTDEEAVIAAVRAAEEHAGGPLSSVVANAGGSTSIGPVTQLGLEDWTATTTLNLTGTMLALKHGSASLVRGGGGSFVAISSTAGSLVHPWFGAYGPAKAGINQLCRQAADELGPSWVRVNAVCPGLIRTDLVEFITAGGPVLDSYTENTPIDRVGEPEDIAALVRFLVGPESTWLTGQVISVDGGQGLRRGPSLAGAIEPLFGADGLRGVVAEPT